MLKVSETFRSLQGEGPGSGKPSFFLRLAGCNLHCHWCDTKYTWDFRAYDYETEVTSRTLAALALEIAESGLRRVVVTGGEPLLQQAALAPLLLGLPADHFLEVETNGTILPLPELVSRVDQWNVSPKLTSAGDPAPARLRRGVLAALAATQRAWLKLVVESAADIDEAAALVAELEWPAERVLLMPRASTRAELTRAGPHVAKAALLRGFGYSSRLHVELWDGQRGR